MSIIMTECDFCGKSRQLCGSTTMGYFCRDCIIIMLNELDNMNTALWEAEQEEDE